jgi:hypothetical protein
MFGLEPPSVDMKNLDTKYEELIFYLYAEYKDTCGGARNPTDDPCSGFTRPSPYNLWLSGLILTNSKFLAEKPFNKKNAA